jgi:DNA gyrase subunit B
VAEAEIRREGHVWTMDFVRGEMTDPLKKLGKSDKTGTKITFKPDPEIFPDTKFTYDVLHKRVQELAFLTAGVRFRIVDERTGQQDEFHYENGIVEFVRYLNRTENAIYPEIIQIQGTYENVEVNIALQHNDGYSENVRAFANNIYNLEGGTHTSGFRSALTRSINAYGKKQNIFKDATPSGDDFREGLTAVVTVRVPDPQFEGQTKTKLGNSEVEGIVTSVVNDGLNRFFEENPSVAKTICNKGLRAAEAREAARKAREMVRKKGGSPPAACPKNSATAATTTSKSANCTWSKATPPADRPTPAATPTCRPSCRCGERSSTSRRPNSSRCWATPKWPPSSRRSACSPVRRWTSASGGTARSS